MYVRTGIGGAGESHGKALGRVTRGGVPLYVPVLVRYCIHLAVYVMECTYLYWNRAPVRTWGISEALGVTLGGVSLFTYQ
jgi:hypothetical protein